MDIDCGECNNFAEGTEANFGELLKRRGFQPVKCTAERGGRECTLMMESSQLRLLFVRSDGAETCDLGSLDAEFPEDGLVGQGENGWYHLVTLLEFKTGKKLLTQRRIAKFSENQEEYYAWQAELLSEHEDMLFEMFGDNQQVNWHEDFMGYYRELVGG